MPHSSLTHPPFGAFFYMTVLLPSSHYSIIYVLSLICANVVIICKCHTKTGCSCRHFLEIGGDSPRPLLQLPLIWKHFWEISGPDIPSGISTGDCISSPEAQNPSPASASSTGPAFLQLFIDRLWTSRTCAVMSLPSPQRETVQVHLIIG